MTAEMTIWKNGVLVEPAQAVVSVLDHGLLYGDGVFEGVRYYRRTPFRLERHLRRLARSAAGIGLTIPYDLPALAAAVQQTVDAADPEDGYLRIVVTRGEGSLGVNPQGCERQTVFIIAAQLAVVPSDRVEQGVRAITASLRRLPPDCLDPRIKSLNYLTGVMARAEANRAGADEALLLNRNGHVVEASVANLFVVRGDTLCTPPVTDGALDGITRATVMEVAPACGLRVAERSLTLVDVYDADEALLTGTGAGLLPLREVDGRLIRTCPGPAFRSLQSAYRNLVAAESAAAAPLALA